MSELGNKVQKSIERLKAFEPDEGYCLAFSGGKDSVVCKALLEMSGCKFKPIYRVTSVDPPELVRFIKEKHPDVIREVPRYEENYRNEKLRGKPVTMWNLIPEKKIPPTRRVRYCCEVLKEGLEKGRMTITGVRWAESKNRKENQGIVTMKDVKQKEAPDGYSISKKHGSLILINDNAENRKLVEHCFKKSKTTVNPIIDWTDEDVWEFIHQEGVPYCELYDQGCKRLGCIGCPMASQHQREKEFLHWPKYKIHYMLAFDRMIKKRVEEGKKLNTGINAQEVFNWWMEYDVLPGQIEFDDLEEYE